jgi:hypothetical protein
MARLARGGIGDRCCVRFMPAFPLAHIVTCGSRGVDQVNGVDATQ